MTDGDGARRREGPSIFAFIADNPKPEDRPAEPVVTIQSGPLRRPVVPAVDQTAPVTARLLHWVVNVWPGSALCARDIYRQGPRPVRNRRTALSQAQILVEAGWLEPVSSWRRDRVQYRIARGPSEPTAA
jgi:hypothetical protein